MLRICEGKFRVKSKLLRFSVGLQHFVPVSLLSAAGLSFVQ